jgi:aspartate ammonia-lyase
MMTMLERAIAAAANVVGADPQDLRGFVKGARLREWRPGEWLFRESTPYEWTGIIEEGEVEIVGGARATNTSTPSARARWSLWSRSWAIPPTSPAAHTQRRAPMGITRETMDHARQENPQAYHRVVAPIAQRSADRTELRPDTAWGVSAARPLLTPRTERDQLGCREVPGRAYYGVQTLRAVENFAISGVALRDFSRFIDGFAFVKKAAALANTELGVLRKDKRDAIALR